MKTITSGSQTRKLTGKNDTIERMLVDEDTFGTTMLAIAMDSFAPRTSVEEPLDFLTWSPATLREEFYTLYRVEVLPGNIDRLMQAIDIITSDTFWNESGAFIRGCNVLSGSDASFTDFDPATVDEIAWAVAEATLLWPDDEEDPAFPSAEVRAYVVQQLRKEGFPRPPVMLSEFVQPGELIEATADFDDPDMNLGMSKSSDAKASEVDTAVQQEMGKLIRQLETVPFQHGETKKLAESLRKGLSNAPASSR